MQQIEPAARLPDVLDDEVARVMGVEPLAVLEWVVDLSERHRARVEPHVENVGDADHLRLARRVVGVGPHKVVDVRAVKVGLAVLVERESPKVRLDIGERAVHVHARVVRVVAHPHGDGRAEVAVATDGPVASALEPLAELAVLDVLGHPGDLLIELDHAVAELGDAHEPRADCPVDQGVAAAPAMRVAVVVGLVTQHDALRLERVDDRLVRVEHL